MKYLEYRERKQHGTFDFPVEFYHVTLSHPRYEMAYHWHTEYELIRIIKGEFLITLDENIFTAKAGDIVFVQSGALHGGIPVNCIYECIVFDMDTLAKHNSISKKYMQQIINQMITIQYVFPHKKDSLHEISNHLFESMRHKSFGYELTILGYLYQLFGCILDGRYYTTSSGSPAKNGKRIVQLKHALELIENSYSSCITLDDLSRAAGMNSKYFCRFFREMTHKSPIDYLNYYRIESACFQLATLDLSITEVALNCGFNDVSYFIKTFKKYKGVTPKKYLSNPL